MSNLLNPIPNVEPPHNREDLHDIRPLLLQLSKSGSAPIPAPRFVYDWLANITQRPGIASRNSPPAPSVQYSVSLNRKTTLSRLFVFEDPSAYLEYPETELDQPVGYLFRQLPESWYNPTRNFVYSLGDPSGATRAGDEVACAVLVDRNSASSEAQTEGGVVRSAGGGWRCQSRRTSPQLPIYRIWHTVGLRRCKLTFETRLISFRLRSRTH